MKYIWECTTISQHELLRDGFSPYGDAMYSDAVRILKNRSERGIAWKEFAPYKGIVYLNISGVYDNFVMRIIAKSTLRAFWQRHPNAEEPLLAWYRETEKADWESPSQVKEKYRSASFVGGNRVVFNIKGNDYRLVVKINYPYRIVYVRFVGTHTDYDKIDVEEV